jgi:hypothetical protein
MMVRKLEINAAETVKDIAHCRWRIDKYNAYGGSFETKFIVIDLAVAAWPLRRARKGANTEIVESKALYMAATRSIRKTGTCEIAR